MSATFETQFTEEAARNMSLYYLREAAKQMTDAQSTEYIENTLACITQGLAGSAMAKLRSLICEDDALTEGYAYCIMQAYACLFIWSHRVADRVLAQVGAAPILQSPSMPFPFTGDVAHDHVDVYAAVERTERKINANKGPDYDAESDALACNLVSDGNGNRYDGRTENGVSE